ncbi:unnamed protein product [Thelazia callipaeda]|uniref:Secreted protein n=1 Tax=Thelazia callipaeda TaxID=103827 RepID=A0A0N5D3W9_THECL|nr:unnamed protein product [Thelazia callipaeda]
MCRELYAIVLLWTVCLAVPISDANLEVDSDQQDRSRVKRQFAPYGHYSPFGGYGGFLNPSPYSYKIKTPFFKVKVKGDPYASRGVYPNYGLGGGFHSPIHNYGFGGGFHSPIHSPYNFYYNQNAFGGFG